MLVRTINMPSFYEKAVPKEGGKDDRIKGKGKTFRTQRTENNRRSVPPKRRTKKIDKGGA